MKICHISDTHGSLPRLNGDFDIIVHSGDILPDISFNKTHAMMGQMKWLEENLIKIKEWINNKLFLFIPGNHDFLNPDLISQVLRSESIRNINLTNELITYEGIRFYGFPYVPTINGFWEYEANSIEMNKKVDQMMENDMDIIVAHAPLYKILDRTTGNEHIGNNILNNAFEIHGKQPMYYLHGHCHEANGIEFKHNILVSNAAMTQHIIEIK
jgi:Icc-related predicted phosphoesterase